MCSFILKRALCKPPLLAVRPFRFCLQVLLPQQSTQAPKCRRSKGSPDHEESGEKDVDALTFMQTVIMSFVRGMEYGDQTLPINDLFVYFPVQLHLSGCEMATLAAYNPGHGINPWSGMKTRPSDHSYRGLTHLSRVWARALARVQSRPEVTSKYFSPYITSYSCLP